MNLISTHTISFINKKLPLKWLFLSSIFILLLGAFNVGLAQVSCEVEKSHGQGFTTSIVSVDEVPGGRHTITLLVSHDGCAAPDCQPLTEYLVETLPRTFSNNISIEIISGDMTYGGLTIMFPNQGGDPFFGFKITNISGIGGGSAGQFKLSYTLAGGFQNQQTIAKTSSGSLIASFASDDFDYVLNCEEVNIYPYYEPPVGGKIFNSLIGPELTTLYNTFINTGSVVSDNIFKIDGDNVLIRVFALSGQLNNLENILTSPLYGMTDEIVIPQLNAITGWFPIENLLMIDELETEVNYARPEYPPQSNSGLVTTQGDIAMRSGIARNVFNLRGAGAKLGVLSDSFNKLFGNPANDDILKGDLPGIGIDPDGNLVPNPVNVTDVEVLKDYPYLGSDEGRAMLQIIHDIAPEANLAFRTGFLNPFDFAQGIIDLKNAGCNIIVDDITYITEPFFTDGVVAQAVNTVVAEGVTYFSAAGNFGSNSYENIFYAGAPPPGLTGTAHNFAGANGYDIFQSVSMGEGNYLIVLQWDDGSEPGTTNTDLDIYITNNDGNTLFGFNRVNIGGDPIEVLPFTVGPGGAQANLVILKPEGADNVRFKYIVFRGQLVMNEYANVGNSTIVGQPNAEGAIAVGAVLYSNTPKYGVDPPTIASFSSLGGTLINGVDRQKPEISAPNGVNTTVDLGGPDIEGDLFPNFFGTSAAAPHAAGVAALLIEAKSKFYDTTISPQEIRDILTSTALDMGNPGYDRASGYGFIQADAALFTLAHPAPLLLSLTYDSTLMPGFDTVQIIIRGRYLTAGSQIYFNGEPLETETTFSGDTLAITIIPPFEGLYPKIQIYNPPSPFTNGLDGGLSDPIYFTTRETILISIDNESKKYGETLPEFTASYSVETLNGSYSLEDAGLSDDEITRILSIPLVAPNVTPLSNAGFWAITPSASDPLNPMSGLQPADSLDMMLLERFEFVFLTGILDIERLDLLVKPQHATFVYGEPIEDIAFDYIFNNDPDNPLSIPEVINTQILSLLQLGHATALVTGKATALVNTQATALVNRSFMISSSAFADPSDLIEVIFENPDLLFDSVALANGLATALVNGQATALVNARALVTGQATALVNGQATALVNAARLGQATALVNTNTFNATNNKEAVIMLTDEDIYILAGLEEGEVTLISMNLIPDDSAGTHWLLAGTLVTNNFNVIYEPGEITFLKAPATITFVEESLTQTYNGSPISPVVVTEPEGLGLIITFDGQIEAPVNAGIYQVVATVTDTNYTGTKTATLTIEAVQLSVMADDKEKMYGEGDPLFTYQITEGALIGNDELTGQLSREPGEDVGSYAVLQGILSVGDNYQIVAFAPGTLTITQAPLTISAEDIIIYSTDPLPELSFTFSGFVFDDDESVLTDLGYTTTPEFNGEPGVYTTTPHATTPNYFIIPVEGTMFVNPAGPGTRYIIPRLFCIEKTEPGSDYAYIAYFMYANFNTVNVYVPKGPENSLTAIGSFNDAELPEVFVPGIHTFAVPFTGVSITWAITSMNNEGRKVTYSRTATPGSPVCRKSEELSQFDSVPDPVDAIVIFPNPARDKVFLKTDEARIHKMKVMLYDVLGNQLRVDIIRNSGNLFEINLAGLRSGVYLIHVMHTEGIEILRLVKHQ